MTTNVPKRSWKARHRDQVTPLVGSAAMVVQLLLAGAVAVAIVVGLITRPAATAPWAFLYLGWCVAMLRHLVDRSANS